MIKKLFQEEEAQGLTEYALLVFLISVAVIGAILLFRRSLVNSFIEPATNEMEKSLNGK